MANKDSECLEGLKDWDVIILSETWMNKGNERRQETLLPKLIMGGKYNRRDEKTGKEEQ